MLLYIYFKYEIIQGNWNFNCLLRAIHIRLQRLKQRFKLRLYNFKDWKLTDTIS